VVPGFCTSDADPELFFPIGNAGPTLLQLDQAKQVCGAQSLRRAWSGLWAGGQEAGVWGGASEPERRALRRMRRTPADAEPT